jgi:hypothetical protein
VKAKAGLQDVLARVPQNREAKKALARVLIRQKDTASAIHLLTTAIADEVGPKAAPDPLADPALYELLGDAYTAANDPRACEAFRSALAASKRAVYNGDRGRLRRKAACH